MAEHNSRVVAAFAKLSNCDTHNIATEDLNRITYLRGREKESAGRQCGGQDARGGANSEAEALSVMVSGIGCIHEFVPNEGDDVSGNFVVVDHGIFWTSVHPGIDLRLSPSSPDPVAPAVLRLELRSTTCRTSTRPSRTTTHSIWGRQVPARQDLLRFQRVQACH